MGGKRPVSTVAEPRNDTALRRHRGNMTLYIRNDVIDDMGQILVEGGIVLIPFVQKDLLAGEKVRP